MRSPNEEQEEAVKTHGNVLLKAGAGSGKTFVIVRHVVFLLEKFLDEKADLKKTAFVKTLHHYLSGMAVITYTRKSAGELNLRLRGEIDQMVKNHGEKGAVLQRHFDSLFIGTIHSFFLRLLRQGYFPECGNNFPIVGGNYKIKKKISKILDDWLDKEFINNIKKTKKSVPMWSVVSDISKLETALIKIFENSNLRILWEGKFSKEESDENIWNNILHLWECDGLITTSFLFPEPQKKAKWFKFYRLFEDFKKKTPLTLDSVSQYINFLNADQAKYLRAPKYNVEISSYISKVQKLKNCLNKNAESLVNYNPEETRAWRETFKEIFHYVSLRYNFIQEFNYDDIEYYTLKGLLNPINQKRIIENIKYLIIDEFQDVSTIQYKIIKNIIGNDFQRLYCVGDEKQAIYGFRGGDLGVFFNVDKNIANRLNLKTNYRSTKEVIQFNNIFFKKIFKNFFFPQIAFQEEPSNKTKFKGGVTQYLLEIKSDDEKSLLCKKEKLEIIEAVKIYEIIKASLKEHPHQKICILYKQIKTSLHLVDILLDDQASFQAQIKIPEGDDPIIALFKVLIEGFLDKDKNIRRYCVFIVTNLLKYLNFFSTVEENIERFYKNTAIVGLKTAFRTFILELGLHNCNYENNLKIIEEIISSNFEDIDNIYSEVCKLAGTYSIDFYVGEKSSQIILMTVHASKGLEFDHVLLGGIHTNGTKNHPIEMLGKTAKSFRWKKHSSERTFLKTPSLILEEILQKEEDLAESQRILYVACTRAKNYLSWVDIQYQGSGCSYLSSSWINELRCFDGKINCIKEERPLSDFEIKKNKNAPLFHSDGLGLALVGGKKEFVGYFSSLSVSHMSYLEQCPRKFYLKNICGLDDSGNNNVIIKHIEKKTLEREGDGIVSAQNPRERGIEIHKIISEIIKSDFEDKVDFNTYPSIRWTINHLKKLRHSSTFSSEEPIQLDLFGNIVTGVVDLICFPQLLEEKIRIVDFKTGKKTEDSEKVYWFQLISYAYAVSQKYRDYTPHYILEICYVDEEQSIVKEIKLEAVKEYLFQRWSLLTSLNQVNENHCHSCPFGKICH